MLIHPPTKAAISPDIVRLLQKVKIEQVRKEYLKELYELRLKYSKQFRNIIRLGDEFDVRS